MLPNNDIRYNSDVRRWAMSYESSSLSNRTTAAVKKFRTNAGIWLAEHILQKIAQFYKLFFNMNIESPFPLNTRMTLYFYA